MSVKKRGKKQIFKNMEKDVFDWNGSVQKKDGKQKELRYTNEALWNVEQSFNEFLRSFVEKIVTKYADDKDDDGFLTLTQEMVDEVKRSFPNHWFNHDTDLLEGCSEPGEMIDRLSQSYVAQLSEDEDEDFDERPVVTKTLNVSISKRGKAPSDCLLETSESEDDCEPKKKMKLSISRRGVAPKDFDEEGGFTDSFIMGFSQSLFDAPLPSVSTLFTPPQIDPAVLIEGMQKSVPEQDEAEERSVDELPLRPEKPKLISYNPFFPRNDENAEREKEIEDIIIENDKRVKEYENKLKEYNEMCTAKRSKPKNLVKRQKKNDMPSF